MVINLTSAEVKKVLGISEPTLRRYVKDKVLNPKRSTVTKRLWFSPEEVEEVKKNREFKR